MLIDFLNTLPLGPVILELQLLPEGRALVGEGFDRAPLEKGLSSARFLWEATLLFSLKLNDFLSGASLSSRSTRWPDLIRSRYSLSDDCVEGSLNQVKKSSSTFIFRTGWRYDDGILMVCQSFWDECACVAGKIETRDMFFKKGQNTHQHRLQTSKRRHNCTNKTQTI